MTKVLLRATWISLKLIHLNPNLRVDSLRNVVTFFKSQSYWQLIAGAFMLSALVMTLYIGSHIIAAPTDDMVVKMRGNGGFNTIVWAYCTIGLFLCYFADATGKEIMAAIGFCWSSITSAWVGMQDHCGVYALCLKEMTYVPFLGLCLVLMVCIYWYETNRPPFHTTSKKDFGLAMRIIFFAWAGSVVFVLVIMSLVMIKIL